MNNYNDTNNNDNDSNKNDIPYEIIPNDLNLVPPMNSVQFMSDWKYLKGNDNARSDYLSVSGFFFPIIFVNLIINLIN